MMTIITVQSSFVRGCVGHSPEGGDSTQQLPRERRPSLAPPQGSGTDWLLSSPAHDKRASLPGRFVVVVVLAVKKLQRKPLCIRSLELSGRLANPAPDTGYEPSPSNFFSYMDTEHTPINVPDSHHNFPCQDDVTMIPTSPEGLPRSEHPAAASKQQLAEFPQCSVIPVSGN